MNYATLTAADQKSILEQRQRQYEAEHFQHTINKDLLVSSGLSDEETTKAIEQADAAIATLDAAHAEICTKLSERE